jgi:UDP-3-O-acyl-N-acetylglucosamine deacetylase
VTDQTALTGSDYVRAVAHQLAALGVAVDLDNLDLDEEQCNLPIADGDDVTWLRWLDDPDHGWHLDDDHGRRAAAICPPDTPVAEAARILALYV